MNGLWQHVEFLPAVNAVAVTDEAQSLQNVQGAVDGGRRGGRIDLAAALHELRAGDVPIRPGQDLHKRAALRGPAQAARPETLTDGRPGDWFG